VSFLCSKRLFLLIDEVVSGLLDYLLYVSVDLRRICYPSLVGLLTEGRVSLSTLDVALY
jgi:hypothetical protein